MAVGAEFKISNFKIISLVERKEIENNKIQLELTEKEANIIIEALGHLPFMKVYKLIEKVHLQAKKKNK